MKPGDRIVIRFNPHREHASGIVGTVVSYEPGAGFMGTDLAYVKYTDPRDGFTETSPFGKANLMAGDREALLAMAVRHEEQAAALRQFAEESS